MYDSRLREARAACHDAIMMPICRREARLFILLMESVLHILFISTLPLSRMNVPRSAWRNSSMRRRRRIVTGGRPSPAQAISSFPTTNTICLINLAARRLARGEHHDESLYLPEAQADASAASMEATGDASKSHWFEAKSRLSRSISFAIEAVSTDWLPPAPQPRKHQRRPISEDAATLTLATAAGRRERRRDIIREGRGER